ncbi:AAC(3) family N-acetyltransferase [Paenibacillus sp. MMS20-IR301]|uniref:aminoglycoside N(3)-acetyltransferase n=1 Tax=Paenibacillus sp. MMS20-IR301 TaxID=2895946 RepID=UPI0028EC9F00|nr:AAC(3) family N-acetyltransferase [Paenibacillus sp. MMS20-IR301]WNS44542.1 AAC(3) family N-acetyltransferase [Paenibacillus sp. MMS20-IR301]
MNNVNEPILMLSKEDLKKQLAAGGLKAGQNVLVHVSLRSLGYVIGGAETLIRALLELVGVTGTLMMPSQTWKNLDPLTGVHWEVPAEGWPLIRAEWPAYDKEITPAVGMGVVAEMLRKWPGAARSDHPARSFAAIGRHAEFLTDNHDLSNIFGSGSPLDRLYQLNGHILLIGVGHDKNTSLHLAETRADFPGKHMVEESSAVLVNGVREWVTYPTLAVDDSDFIVLGQAYEQAVKLQPVQVGHAQVRFMEQRSLVDWATLWMQENRKG